MPLFFNAQLLPQPVDEYVAWVDVMGVQSAMSRSLSISANFVFKLHMAALRAPNNGVSLYPVMDGLYIATPSQQAMLEFLRSVFRDIAEEFTAETENLHRFIVRGALAFGPVIHGAAVPASVATDFGTVSGGQYKTSILLGMPMVQSHLAERNAPPFGLFVHESARTFAPAATLPLHHVWWKWVTPGNSQVWNGTLAALKLYFEWCRSRPDSILYDRERIEVHADLVRQYFTL
jgi:hypothetical protein